MQSKTYHQTDETTSDMDRWWTPERDLFLISLWKQGMTCSRIAGELQAVSKNAILGRVHRLGLKPRTTKVRSRKGRLVNPVGRPPKVRSEIVQLDKHPDPRKLLDPRVNGVEKCRWVEGEPDGVQTVFCSDTALTGASYCARHYARCVTARVSLQLPKAA